MVETTPLRTEDDEPLENQYTVEELRREVRRLWDQESRLVRALREAPVLPDPRLLKFLDRSARYPSDNEIGRRLQREYGLDAVPPVSEYEGGAGLWSRIQAGLTSPPAAPPADSGLQSDSGMIHRSSYGAAPDNYHLWRRGDTLEVELTYPPRIGEPDRGQIRYVTFDQESVRASDGIRLHYDYERDGYAIEQASVFSWPSGDPICDPGWREVAFVQAWSQELPEPDPEQVALVDAVNQDLPEAESPDQ